MTRGSHASVDPGRSEDGKSYWRAVRFAGRRHPRPAYRVLWKAADRRLVFYLPLPAARDGHHVALWIRARAN
jgi:hypothetical protein